MFKFRSHRFLMSLAVCVVTVAMLFMFGASPIVEAHAFAITTTATAIVLTLLGITGIAFASSEQAQKGAELAYTRASSSFKKIVDDYAAVLNTAGALATLTITPYVLLQANKEFKAVFNPANSSIVESSSNLNLSVNSNGVQNVAEIPPITVGDSLNFSVNGVSFSVSISSFSWRTDFVEDQIPFEYVVHFVNHFTGKSVDVIKKNGLNLYREPNTTYSFLSVSPPHFSIYFIDFNQGFEFRRPFFEGVFSNGQAFVGYYPPPDGSLCLSSFADGGFRFKDVLSLSTDYRSYVFNSVTSGTAVNYIPNQSICADGVLTRATDKILAQDTSATIDVLVHDKVDSYVNTKAQDLITSDAFKKALSDAIAESGTTTKPGEGTGEGTVEIPKPGDVSLPQAIITVFPFCIPFDIAKGFELLKVDPIAPRFEIPVKYSNIVNEKIVFDFVKFEPIIKMIRWFELILFILALAIITSRVIKW